MELNWYTIVRTRSKHSADDIARPTPKLPKLNPWDSRPFAGKRGGFDVTSTPPDDAKHDKIPSTHPTHPKNPPEHKSATIPCNRREGTFLHA